MPADYTSYQARTTWYIQSFLLPKELHEFRMEDGETKAAVMEFAPVDHDRIQRSFWTYATNGMSERRMPCVEEPHGDPKIRLELMGYSAHEAPWVVELLKAMAVYPFQHNSGFAIGHTIPVDAPRPRLWDGYLLASPLLEEETFNPLAIDIGIGKDHVVFAQVLGLVGNELELGISKGGPHLVKQLRKACPTHEALASASFLDRKRTSLV